MTVESVVMFFFSFLILAVCVSFLFDWASIGVSVLFSLSKNQFCVSLILFIAYPFPISSIFSLLLSAVICKYGQVYFSTLKFVWLSFLLLALLYWTGSSVKY